MTKMVENNQPVEGYVLEDKNYSEVSLVHYTKNGNQYKPDKILGSYNKDEFFGLQNERDLRKLIGKVHASKPILYRREIGYLIP
jgi:hypothetical protein